MSISSLRSSGFWKRSRRKAPSIITSDTISSTSMASAETVATSVTTTQNSIKYSLLDLGTDVILLHLLPNLDVTQLMALFNTSLDLRHLIIQYPGWADLFARAFPYDPVPIHGSPFENYYRRSRARAYVVWVVNNQAPLLCGPLPRIEISKVETAISMTTVLATDGSVYAICENQAFSAVGPRGHKMFRPSKDLSLRFVRLKHDNTCKPRFVDIWGSHRYIHALTATGELYAWWGSDMKAIRIEFVNRPALDVVKVISCPFEHWHISLMRGGKGLLWWCSHYYAHKKTYRPLVIADYVLFGEEYNIKDIAVVAERVFALTATGDLLSIELASTNGVLVTPRARAIYRIPSHYFRTHIGYFSQISRIIVMCDGSLSLITDKGKYLRYRLTGDKAFAVESDPTGTESIADIYYDGVHSLWELSQSGNVNLSSRYDWALAFLCRDPKHRTPIPISIPNSSSIRTNNAEVWDDTATVSARNKIILNYNVLEDGSTNDLFLSTIVQMAHQADQRHTMHTFVTVDDFDDLQSTYNPSPSLTHSTRTFGDVKTFQD